MVRHEVNSLILDMTGKVIDSSPSSLLVLIIPIAFLIVLVFKAWPVLLGLLIFSIIFKLWQQYQWKRWSQKVNPYFNQLIKENQGCLTPLDLSIKANLTGSDARRYLEKKVEEFGARRQVYEDKGTVYYFLTASALGSIFDESEPLLDLEGDLNTTAQGLLESPKPPETPSDSPSDAPRLESPKPPETSTDSPSDASDSASDSNSTTEIASNLEPMPQLDPLPTALPDEDPDDDLWQHSERQPDSQALIQAELAKRLDVHSSTVGKRKSDADFSEWSQSRDPEGIAWEYSSTTKEFLPMEK
ncbi:MAG: hypothetical protein WBG73_17430 [Coleofasciculaceae cyanobacterium]